MAANVPEYFLSRNWDYPIDGPIQIGNILASLKDAHLPLDIVAPDEATIITSTKTDTSLDKERANSGGVSLLTTFLAGLLPLSSDVAVDVTRGSGKTFKFDRLDTKYINTAGGPACIDGKTRYEAYIDRCIRAPGVVRYLQRIRNKKPVWVITGVKIVSGGSISTSKSRKTDVLVGAQGDGTAIGTPVGGGLQGRAGHKLKFDVSWKSSTDFVLAYKVSRVKVDKDGNMKWEREDRQGSFLGNGEEEEEEEDEELSVTIVERPEPDVKCSTFSLVEDDKVEGIEVEGDEATVLFGVLEDN